MDATVGALPGGASRRAGAMLARAFHEDPLMVHLLPDPGHRSRRLPALLQVSTRYCQSYGAVDAVTTGAVVTGAACWLRPGSTTTTTSRMVGVGGLTLPLRLGPAAFARLSRYGSVADRHHETLVPGPHWYLWVLGVEPGEGGRGLGSALLSAGLARADVDRLPCFLETTNERNLGTYRRRGFEVVADDDVTGVRVWAMRRDPA